MDPVSTSKENISDFWKELAKLVVIAVVIVIPFRLFVAQPFIVEGASMDPTFESGQYLIVDELTYHFEKPARLSILIFKYPKDPSKYFIKRVIGLPGETVSIKNGVVSIINDENPEGIILDEPYIVFKRGDNMSFSLKPGEYFVMGDNRLGSADSRIWGPVPEDNIIGRPIFRLWPLAIWPGDENLNQNETN